VIDVGHFALGCVQTDTSGLSSSAIGKRCTATLGCRRRKASTSDADDSVRHPTQDGWAP
jgi:hypothetical protein